MSCPEGGIHPMTALAIAFLTSAAVSLLITPLSIRWAQRLGIVAHPGSRKVHPSPLPSWGGIAILLGFLVGAGFGAFSLSSFPDRALGLLLGLLAIITLGSLDDRFSLKPWSKLLGQSLAAFLPMAFGLRITFLTNPFGSGYLYLTEWQALVLTFFWIISLTNALNLIDGLDGLAAGVSFFAALTLTFLSADQKLLSVAVPFSALAGACMGFLPYNFHPARVFMGDTGAMGLGYLFATLSILGAVKSVTALSFLFVTVIVLGYPVADTAFAVVRRWWRRRPLFLADQEHLHHRLLDSGLDQRQAVLFLYALTLLFCLLALFLTRPI